MDPNDPSGTPPIPPGGQPHSEGPWYAPPDRGPGGPAGGYFDGEPGRDGPAWEHRESLGLVRAAAKTVGEVLTNPDDTFARAKRTGGFGNPLLFAFLLTLIFGSIQVFIVQISGQSVVESMERIAQQMPDQQMREQMQETVERIRELQAGGNVALEYLFVPIKGALFPFILAGVLHVILMITGGVNQDFESSFRVAAYAFGATMPLRAVPACGTLLGPVWMLVVFAIGSASMHETDKWRGTLAAVLMSPFVCCCCQ